MMIQPKRYRPNTSASDRAEIRARLLELGAGITELGAAYSAQEQSPDGYALEWTVDYADVSDVVGLDSYLDALVAQRKLLLIR